MTMEMDTNYADYDVNFSQIHDTNTLRRFYLGGILGVNFMRSHMSYVEQHMHISTWSTQQQYIQYTTPPLGRQPGPIGAVVGS